MKEGETYSSAISAVDVSLNAIEEIPPPIRLPTLETCDIPEVYSLIFFDLESTGLGE